MSSEAKNNHHLHHPKARLCHIKKWDNFDGYGFNLHAEKGKPGQYIGKVDDNSPAEKAGLRQGDRILEVNGESIANKTHKQVVELIKAQTGETKLLVVDPIEDGIIPTEPPSSNQTTKEPPSTNNHEKLSNNDVVKNKEQLQQQQQQQQQENGSLNLSMTAAELRAKLASKKKFDPKKDANMDFKKKFDIVQKL